jgi:hypothetical protein
MLSQLTHLDINEIRRHYDSRVQIGKTLRSFLKSGDVTRFVGLALGETDPMGNYSARDHGLAHRILSGSSQRSVFSLGELIYNTAKATHIPQVIYGRNIPYLKIGVGSEMASLLRPSRFWVGNVRTIWAHLLLKHKWSYQLTNEELELYRDGERDSEMSYKIWRDMYLSLESSMKQLASLGERKAKKKKVPPGDKIFLWADAIASALYESRDD